MFKELQRKHFPDVVQFISDIGMNQTKHVDTKILMRKKKLVAPSICINLNLFNDHDGIICQFSSLACCETLHYDLRFPVLLPRDDFVVNLLVKHHHVIEGHGGIQQTLTSVRLHYWIPKLGKLVPQVVKSCDNCKEYYSKRYHVPHSPPLPDFRVMGAEAFTFVGVDMTGHYFVKVGADVVKRFVILFSCCSTRAMHLEVVEDASAEAFCRCFLRFVSRRGSPRLLISDNGSNLVHFSKDLLSISDSSFTKYLLVKDRVEWKFIPVYGWHL